MARDGSLLPDDSGDGPLLGLLVDVSFSMMRPVVQAGGTEPRSRLQAVRTALDALVLRAGRLQAAGNGPDLDDLEVFVLGFGFRPYRGRPTRTPGDGRIRNLLNVSDDQSGAVVRMDALVREWGAVKAGFTTHRWDFLGPTSPLAEALEIGCAVFHATAEGRRGRPTLCIVTDGEPSDPDGAPRVREATRRLRASGIVVMTCLLGHGSIGPRHTLLGKASGRWPAAARLMFDCASELAEDDPIRDYLREAGWRFAPEARLFTAVDGDDELSRLLSTMPRWLGPVDEDPAGEPPAAPKLNVMDEATVVGNVIQAHHINNLNMHLGNPPSPPEHDAAEHHEDHETL